MGIYIYVYTCAYVQVYAALAFHSFALVCSSLFPAATTAATAVAAACCGGTQNAIKVKVFAK